MRMVAKDVVLLGVKESDSSERHWKISCEVLPEVSAPEGWQKATTSAGGVVQEQVPRHVESQEAAPPVTSQGNLNSFNFPLNNLNVIKFHSFSLILIFFCF